MAFQGYSYEENQGALSTTEVKRRKALVRQSNECGNVAVNFFTCDMHLMGGVTLRIALTTSIDDFVNMLDDATKHYKMNIFEANLYARMMTLNNDVVSAIDEFCLLARRRFRTLKPLQKRF